MKKLLLIIFLSTGATVVALAQQYGKFRVGFGAGFTLKPTDEMVAQGGIIILCEPAFHLRDNLVIGVRMEFADTHLDILWSGYGVGSFALNGQYYLGTKKFRPLVGVGFGWFNIKALEPPEHLDENAKFGFYPRVGFEVGHFFLTMEYNLIPPSKSIYLDEIRNNYFGFTIGFFAGGGKMPTK